MVPAPALDKKDTKETYEIVSPPSQGIMVRSFALSSDGLRALSGGDDRILRLWNLKTGKCEREFNGHKNHITSVVLTPDGLHALSGSNDDTVRLWNLKTGDCEKVFEGHEGGVRGVVLSPDGLYALSGCGDKTLRLWNLKTGMCEKVLKGHAFYVKSVAISSNGRQALSGSTDKTLRLWNLQTGVCEKVLEGHTDEVYSVALSPDGLHALSGSFDKNLRFWNLQTGVCEKVLEGHLHRIWSVAFSTNGLHALSGSDDKTVCLWDLKTGNMLSKIDVNMTTVSINQIISSNKTYYIAGLITGELKVVVFPKSKTQLEEEISSFQKEITQLKEVMASLKLEVDQQKESDKKLEKQCAGHKADLTRQIQKLTADAQQQKETLDTLLARGLEHQTAKAEQETLQQGIKKLQSDIDQLTQEETQRKQTATRQQQEREATLKHLEQQIEQLEQKTKNHQIKKAALEKELENNQQALTLARLKQESTQTNHKEAEELRQKQQSAATLALTTELTQLQEEASRLQKEISQLEAQGPKHEQAEAEHQKIQKTLGQLEREIKRLKQEATRFQEEENEQAQNRETENQRLTQQLDKLKDSEKRLKESIVSLREQLEASQKSLHDHDSTQKRIEQLQKALIAHQQQESTDSELQKQRVADIATLERQIKVLKEQQKHDQTEVDKLKKQEAEYQKALADHISLQTEQRSLQQKSEQLKREILQAKDLQAKIKQLEQEIDTTKQTLAKVQGPGTKDHSNNLDQKLSSEQMKQQALRQEIEKLRQRKAQSHRKITTHQEAHKASLLRLHKEMNAIQVAQQKEQALHDAQILQKQKAIGIATDLTASEASQKQRQDFQLLFSQAMSFASQSAGKIEVVVENVIPSVQVTPVDFESLQKQFKEYFDQRAGLWDKASQALDPEKQALLNSVLQKESVEQQEIRERQFILGNPLFSDYYYFFQMQFNDALLACHVIHSGMVDNNQSTALSTAGQGLQALSSHIPLAGIVLDILGGVLQALDYRQKKECVNRGAKFIVGAASIERFGEILARQLILAQMNILPQIVGQEPVGFFQKQRKNLNALKNSMLVNDINTELRKHAEEQCQKLLQAIFLGALNPNPDSVEPLLQVMLKPHYIEPQLRNKAFELALALQKSKAISLEKPDFLSIDKKVDIEVLKQEEAKLQAELAVAKNKNRCLGCL